MNENELQVLLNTLSDKLSDWHTKDLTWFDLDELIVPDDSISYLIIKLGFHNYCTWHLIEGYEDNDPQKVHFVYAGGLAHNKDRNKTIELIDDYFIHYQKGMGKINSETLASIIDRISVLYLKMLHMKMDNDPRSKMVENQTRVLERCLMELYYDMLSGERQIAPLSRFKTTGYNV